MSKIELHKGTSRWVICSKKYAVKIPCLVSYISFLSGLIANVYELKHFKYAKQGVFPLSKLCPILFHLPFGLILIMRRAKILSKEEFDLFDFDNFVYICNNATLPVERKNDSFGYVDGIIVAVDYE